MPLGWRAVGSCWLESGFAGPRRLELCHRCSCSTRWMMKDFPRTSQAFSAALSTFSNAFSSRLNTDFGSPALQPTSCRASITLPLREVARRSLDRLAHYSLPVLLARCPTALLQTLLDPLKVCVPSVSTFKSSSSPPPFANAFRECSSSGIGSNTGKSGYGGVPPFLLRPLLQLRRRFPRTLVRGNVRSEGRLRARRLRTRSLSGRPCCIRDMFSLVLLAFAS